jgi:cytochrome c553
MTMAGNANSAASPAALTSAIDQRRTHMKQPALTLLFGLTLAAGGLSVNAEDAASPSGEDLFKFHGCVNCHGVDGKDPVSKTVPELAGQPASEIYANASKILGGKGTTEESKLMHAAFYSPASCDAPPSSEHLRSIARWLSSR